MGTAELRHIITEQLSQIEYVTFLEAIKTIIDSKISGGIYQLSNFEKERIDSAREDLKNYQTISHNEVQKEINKWLKEK